MTVKTPQQIQARFQELGFKWFPFHLVGIRSKEDKPDVFDDHFYLFKGEEMYQYTGTTNPGVYWLQNPMNIEGTAVMIADQQCIDAYIIGRHQGKYPCWKQAKAINFFRDNDKDNKSEVSGEGTQIHSVIGANIHRANEKLTSSKVDKWSAACQVFNNPIQFKQLMLFSENSKQKFFTYTLLSEW